MSVSSGPVPQITVTEAVKKRRKTPPSRPGRLWDPVAVWWATINRCGAMGVNYFSGDLFD